MRRLQPGLQPITLFEHLQDKYPGQYDKNHRTLQRRIKQWHALYGSDQEVIFRQQQQPGQQALVDFTVLKGIVILIAGSVLNFRLFHFRLAYCKWSYLKIVQGGERVTPHWMKAQSQHSSAWEWSRLSYEQTAYRQRSAI